MRACEPYATLRDGEAQRITASNTDTQHIVPLSKQALAILRELQPLTQFSDYAFPGGRSLRRPMSDNALVAAFRRMGISGDEMTAHGFRAMAPHDSRRSPRRTR